MKYLLSVAALALVTACSPPQPAREEAPGETAQTPSVEGLPAGAYVEDKAHTSLTFSVNHLSFSNYTARFSNIGIELQLDPAHPEQASLRATIDPASLALNTPPAGFLNELLGAQWFDVAQFPAITYRSTQIEMTGPNTARIHGDLTLRGVTKPVVLEATFNGGWAGIPPDPHARIGFSAHGTLNRSEFDMGYGVPPPGTSMGVSDAVAFTIETELTGPDWVNPAAATAPAATP